MSHAVSKSWGACYCNSLYSLDVVFANDLGLELSSEVGNSEHLGVSLVCKNDKVIFLVILITLAEEVNQSHSANFASLMGCQFVFVLWFKVR